MFIRNLKRWHWIVISLLIGLIFGYFNHLPAANWKTSFGEPLIREQFENGLVNEQSGLRWFRNITVYPERVESGGKTIPILIVAGDYFDGRFETQNGQRVAVWKPRCFISEGTYDSITPYAGWKPGDTVLDYLKSVKGANYRYAWWRDPKWAISLWTAGSFIVIGLIWPTAINLILFGSIVRPKEAGIDLSKVRATPATAEKGPSEADLSAVSKLAEDLESKLAKDAAAANSDQKPAEHAAPRPLTATALEVASADPNAPHAEFGQDPDDFYPTERHVHHHPDPNKKT